MGIKEIKEICMKPVTTEQEDRTIIYWYIIYNRGIQVPQTITAKINDRDMFNTNVNIAKSYFKTFIYD